jgi:hypothetical protein
VRKVVGLLLLLALCSACSDQDVFYSWQTSADMHIKHAKVVLDKLPEAQKEEGEKKYLLLYDIYIKAHSYAIINKIFFFVSIISALAVFLWPSMAVIFKSKLDRWEWLKSATVQTTVTTIAAVMFTFYSQYKDKQTSAENLMRHVVYSEIKNAELAPKVTEELAKIDNGFSFNSLLGSKEDTN